MSAEAAAKGRIYFPHLDALRTCAFLAVFLRHSFRVQVEGFDGPDVLKRFFAFVSNGAYGVSAFFVLSGFLITLLLLAEERADGSISVARFYVRRVLRIWPLYYLVLFVGLVAYPVLRSALGLDNPFSHEWPMYLVFLANFDVMNAHLSGSGWNTLMMVAITWSVAIEEQFYLVWPWLVRGVGRFRWCLFLSIVIGSYAFRLVYVDSEAVLHFHTLAVVGDLALGALVAEVAFSRPKFLTPLVSLRGGRVLLVYAVVVLVLMYQESVLDPASGRVVQAVCFAYVIIDQCYGSDARVKLSRVPFFSSLGKYTYGLYLLHPVAITIADVSLRRLVPSLVGGGLAWATFAVSLPLSLVLALSSYHALEARFLALKQRFV